MGAVQWLRGFRGVNMSLDRTQHCCVHRCQAVSDEGFEESKGSQFQWRWAHKVRFSVLGLLFNSIATLSVNLEPGWLKEPGSTRVRSEESFTAACPECRPRWKNPRQNSSVDYVHACVNHVVDVIGRARTSRRQKLRLKHSKHVDLFLSCGRYSSHWR
jgi:hypothetical protein